MTNKKNFTKLINKLKKLQPNHGASTPDHKFSDTFFNLTRWQYACGAPACMAGHGGLLFGDTAAKARLHEVPDYNDSNGYLLQQITSDALGISNLWAKRYLYIPSAFVFMRNVQPAEAAAALKVVRDAGEDYEKLTGGDIWKMAIDRETAERLSKETATDRELNLA